VDWTTIHEVSPCGELPVRGCAAFGSSFLGTAYPRLVTMWRGPAEPYFPGQQSTDPADLSDGQTTVGNTVGVEFIT